MSPDKLELRERRIFERLWTTERDQLVLIRSAIAAGSYSIYNTVKKCVHLIDDDELNQYVVTRLRENGVPVVDKIPGLPEEPGPVAADQMLVACDPDDPDAGAGPDFLVPASDQDGLHFLGLRSRRRFRQGRVVYTGRRRKITAQDLVAELVKAGERVEDKDRKARQLNAYLHMLRNLEVGAVFELMPSDCACGFELRETSVPRVEGRDHP